MLKERSKRLGVASKGPRLVRRDDHLGPTDRSQRRAPYLCATPFAVLFLMFFVAPLIYSLYLSFKSGETGKFVGFGNYRYVISLGSFWHSIERMLYFGVIQVAVMIVIALTLALFLDSPYCRGKRLFSLIYFLPYAVPGVIAAIMWGFLFSPTLDGLMRLPHTLSVTSANLDPLSRSFVLYAIMIVVTWEFTGYNMTIYMTGLSSVSREVIEAARIDGASEWNVARRVKLPLLRRTIMFTVVLSIIGTLQLFNEPEIINSLVPLGSSYTPNLLIYSTAFSFGNIPLAAAESVVLAVITIVASLTFFRVVANRERRQNWSGQSPPVASQARVLAAGDSTVGG